MIKTAVEPSHPTQLLGMQLLLNHGDDQQVALSCTKKIGHPAALKMGALADLVEGQLHRMMRAWIHPKAPLHREAKMLCRAKWYPHHFLQTMLILSLEARIEAHLFSPSHFGILGAWHHVLDRPGRRIALRMQVFAVKVRAPSSSQQARWRPWGLHHY